jgi:hypothetical protein
MSWRTALPPVTATESKEEESQMVLDERAKVRRHVHVLELTVNAYAEKERSRQFRADVGPFSLMRTRGGLSHVCDVIGPVEYGRHSYLLVATDRRVPSPYPTIQLRHCEVTTNRQRALVGPVLPRQLQSRPSMSIADYQKLPSHRNRQ